MEGIRQSNMAKSVVLFFSRNYQAKLFPKLNLSDFDVIHVTLTKAEKKLVEGSGGNVVGCFEEDFHSLELSEIEYNYLITSFGADRYLRKLNIEKRRIVLSKAKTFWQTILRLYKPLAVINEPVALEISEVLYIETREIGCKYLTLASFLMQENFWFQDNPIHSRIACFNELKADVQSNDLAIKFYDRIKSRTFNPFYVKDSEFVRSFKSLFNESRNFFKSIFYLIVKRNILILKTCYEFNPVGNLYRLALPIKFLSKFYIYTVRDFKSYSNYLLYPLHFEPEAVLSYASFHFENQCNFIESILKGLPVNDCLIVKEHPNQRFELLSSKYLQLKRKYPNLIFLKSDFDNGILFKKLNAVFTLGSSFGIEALVHGIPVINLGRVYYDQFPGVVNLNSSIEIYEFLRKSRYREINVVREEIIESIARVFTLMKSGKPFLHKDIFDHNNIIRISESIDIQLKSIK
jgi:hypothetical protein